MEDIIAPIDKQLLLSELTDERFVRDTNYGGNKIYIVNAHNAPNTMREIGRLRELAFRQAGGGTGKSCDIDECDTREIPYQQQFTTRTANLTCLPLKFSTSQTPSLITPCQIQLSLDVVLCNQNFRAVNISNKQYMR